MNDKTKKVEAGSDNALGLRIKRLRQSLNWSLTDLAARSGVASSTISKVENGLQSLSYDRLLSMANAFEMELSDFIAGADSTTGSEDHGFANSRLTVERRGDSKLIETNNCNYEYLCTRIRHKGITPLVVEIKARSIEEFGDLISHEGEEFIYVLSGKIELHTEFYGPELLRPGDSAYYDSRMGHGCISVSDEPAFIVNTMTSVKHIPEPKD